MSNKPESPVIHFRNEKSLDFKTLNPALAIRQGLDQGEIDQIAHLHRVRDYLFARCKIAVKNNSRTWMTLYRNALETLEFKLQRLWGFEEDSTMHEWYRIPGCTCPKMDNAERRGTPCFVVNMDCPHHGEEQ